jgi:hypothetical protein
VGRQISTFVGRIFTDFQRSTDSKIPFTALKGGTTELVGDDPVSARVQRAVGPLISKDMG